MRALSDFSLSERIALLGAFRPPWPGEGAFCGCRWRTWAEYVEDYRSVEAELEKWAAGRPILAAYVAEALAAGEAAEAGSDRYDVARDTWRARQGLP